MTTPSEYLLLVRNVDKAAKKRAAIVLPLHAVEIRFRTRNDDDAYVAEVFKLQSGDPVMPDALAMFVLSTHPGATRAAQRWIESGSTSKMTPFWASRPPKSVGATGKR